ncbi:hypothetical protein [Burkholderia pseudomallei]|uniref:hypothetical protein n=1 Tax=Burkholderia pseudomallei TaxID=28450 RepID=UPI0012F4F76D|nr:hypothetical protein [Burkholderia pseudomallei]
MFFQCGSRIERETFPWLSNAAVAHHVLLNSAVANHHKHGSLIDVFLNTESIFQDVATSLLIESQRLTVPHAIHNFLLCSAEFHDFLVRLPTGLALGATARDFEKSDFRRIDPVSARCAPPLVDGPRRTDFERPNRLAAVRLDGLVRCVRLANPTPIVLLAVLRS